MEDYTRFVLDSDELSAELKALRHDLASATRPWVADAILYRDTPGDVGTTHATAAESKRADIADVVVAAGKRLGEALRAIEEFAKTLGPADAVEAIRYRFYDIELSIARTLRPAGRFDQVRLYILITEAACQRPWLETAEAAIAGGAQALQLREKNLEGAEFLRRANQFVELCRKRGVISIINDRPDIAVLCDADGVHVGQGDLPATEVRKIIGRNKIIGVSTHEISQANRAVLDGADYIGVGPIFRSGTKPRDWAEIPGLAYAQQVAGKIKIPAVAIAGITAENLHQVVETGIKAVAVTAAATGCNDVRGATERLAQTLASFQPKADHG